MSSIDQQFIEYIVKSLVSNPDAVTIERRIDEKGVLLELTVDPEDLGRVIGKRGATAQSLRTLLRALGTKNDARYNLKIIDNGEPMERREPRAESPKESPQNEPVVTVSATTDDSAVDDDDVVTTDDEKEAEDHSSAISKTRKELAELDDLDV
jgi:predicted RNA-binding protein YlqC (UPF0109 family)